MLGRIDLCQGQETSLRGDSSRRRRRKRRFFKDLLRIFLANILFLAHSYSSIFPETVSANLLQVNAQLHHLSIARAIHSSAQTTPLLARKKRKGSDDLGYPQIARKYLDIHGQDTHEYGRAKISEFLKENPILHSLNMFQLDGPPSGEDSSIIDITSPNLDKPKWKNHGVYQTEELKNKHPLLSKRQSSPASLFGRDKQMRATKLGSEEDVFQAYGALVPKVTSPKIDNFNEIYQFFNNSYFGFAIPENYTKSVPYPQIYSKKIKAKENTRLKSNLLTTTTRSTTKTSLFDHIETTTPSSTAIKGSSMRDYFNTFISDRQTYANSSDDHPHASDSTNFDETEHSNRNTSEGNSPSKFKENKADELIFSSNAIELSESTMNSAEERKMSEFLRRNSTTPFGRRFAPRPVQFVAEDITGRESLGLLVFTTQTLLKTTSSPPTSTTSVYFAVRNEDEILEESQNNTQVSSTSLRPWERKRGDDNKPLPMGNFNGADDLIPIASVATKFVGDKVDSEIMSSTDNIYNINTAASDSRNNAILSSNRLLNGSRNEIFFEPYTTSQMRTEESNDNPTITNNQELSTLIPFPPIMPGGQFYVDQHISYGQFGRSNASDMTQNVVYDPNVLESRYGFSGILPVTVPKWQTASSTQSSKMPQSKFMLDSPNIISFPPPPPLFASKTFQGNFQEKEKFAKSNDTEAISSRLEKFQTKQMRKPTTFGVQNVPIVLHRIVPPANFNNIDQEHDIRPSNAFTSGAAYFFIPKSQKLNTSKNVKLRAHGQASLIPTESNNGGNTINSPSLFSFLNENKKVARLLDRNVYKGLLADTNITDSRRRSLLNKLNATPDSALFLPAIATLPNTNLSTTSNNSQPLYSGGNSADSKLIKFEADGNGNPLNWRPLSGSGSESRPFRSEKEVLPSIRLVPLPDLLQPLKGKVKENVQDRSITGNSKTELESINEFDPSVTPMCHASDDSNSPIAFSPRLIPAIKKCFRRSTNCILQQAKPLERRINFSEEQCISFCGSHSYCISTTYSKSLKICDVYNIRNGTGSARLYRHKDFHYYETRRKSSIEETSSTDCWRENAPYADVIASAENQLAILVDSHDSSTHPSNGENAHSDISSNGDDGHLLTVKAPKDTCPGDRDIIVFKSAGYRLLNPAFDLPGLLEDEELGRLMNQNASSALESPLEQSSSETECIFSCLINLARGSTPYECMAATFNVGERRCLLYSMGNNLNGNIHLIPDLENNHYEKGCISMELVELCKGYPIIRHAQKTLLGFAMVSRFAASFVECIEICFADRQNAHHQNINELKNRRYCKSVMFFYEETSSKNCILNSENRESAPAFFVDENEALVDYASFESCYEVHSEVDEELLASEVSPTFTDFDAADAHISIGQRELSTAGEVRRAQPSFFYAVDSDSGASPIHAGQSPSPDRPNWQLTIPPGLDKPNEIYGDETTNNDLNSENNLNYNPKNSLESVEPPPRAQIPHIAGSLSGLLRMENGKHLQAKEKMDPTSREKIDMRDM